MDETALYPLGLIDVETLAKLLCVRTSWVYSQTAEGRIPHVRVGRYVRFRWPEVLEWLARDAAGR